MTGLDTCVKLIPNWLRLLTVLSKMANSVKCMSQSENRYVLGVWPGHSTNSTGRELLQSSIQERFIQTGPDTKKSSQADQESGEPIS